MAGCVVWGVGVASLASIALTWSSDVNACSCAAGVYLQWPREGTTGVAIDTPVVVGGEVEATMFGDDGDASLLAVDGGVGLDPADKLVLISEGEEALTLVLEDSVAASACVREFHFAEPRTVLAVNTRYELRYGTQLVGAFTTGTDKRNVEAERMAAERLSFEVLGSTADPTQITTAFVTNVDQQPLYLNFTGSVTETTLAMHLPTSRPVQLNFGALACPEVRVLGADGELLTSRSLCDAQRCLESGGEFVQSSCGGNYAVDIDYEGFRALPVGCPDRDPALGEVDSSPSSAELTDGGVKQEEPQKVAVRHNSRGCTLSAAPSEGAWTTFIALAALWRRRHHQRSTQTRSQVCD